MCAITKITALLALQRRAFSGAAARHRKYRREKANNCGKRAKTGWAAASAWRRRKYRPAHRISVKAKRKWLMKTAINLQWQSSSKKI
jgi:hypothetical protein